MAVPGVRPGRGAGREANDTRVITVLDCERQASSGDEVGSAMTIDQAALGERTRPRGADALSERDRAILAFERQWWKYAGAKETAIRELFGLSATRYYQILNGLIDDPDALAADPLLVKRLRRMRDERQRARSARRLGTDS